MFSEGRLCLASQSGVGIAVAAEVREVYLAPERTHSVWEGSGEIRVTRSFHIQKCSFRCSPPLFSISIAYSIVSLSVSISPAALSVSPTIRQVCYID